MKLQRSRNTKKESVFQFLIIPSSARKGWYTALCFELGLIREGKDCLRLKQQISKLAFNYYRSVAENNLSDDLLNQSLPKKYVAFLKRTKGQVENEKLCKRWEDILTKELWRLRTEIGKKTPTLI